MRAKRIRTRHLRPNRGYEINKENPSEKKDKKKKVQNSRQNFYQKSKRFH